jgi:DNA repair protein RadD
VAPVIPKLRWCQDDLIDDIADKFGYFRRVVARADTGFGKTIVFCALAARAMRKGKRVVIVAHRIEIVEQISRALDSFGVRHGRIQTGHPMTNDLIQVCMVITAAKRLNKIAEPHLLVVDECHHAVAASWKIISDAWQRTRILGVTATPIRTDGRGLSEAFDVMVQAIPMRDLINEGFLSDFVYLAPPQIADFKGIKRRGGDMAIGELAAATNKPVITGDAIQHAKRHLKGKPAIAFCCDVKHANDVAELFSLAGFRAASVDGAMDKDIRRDRIKSIGDGRLDILTACDIISEGTDIPVVGGAILLRGTDSLSMYLQQCGRVLRPKPDGSKAIILDHVGSYWKHGAPDQIREWTLEGVKKRPKKPDEEDPIKQCMNCFAIHSPAPVCPHCGYRHPIRSRVPEQEDGELMEMDLHTAPLVPLKEALRGITTASQLRAVARERGYRNGWVMHQCKLRQISLSS